jgi:hypothetical protein
MLPVVQAQAVGGTPAWVENLPSDSSSAYFLGRSSQASLSNAKTDSFNDAVKKASSALTPGEPYTGNSFVRDAAVVQDTFFTFEKKSSTYIYYTLLRIGRENLHPPLAVYRQKD